MKSVRYVLCGLLCLCISAAYVADSRHVGEQKDGTVLVATGQTLRPAGKTLTYKGRPIDSALSPDGAFLYVKDDTGVAVIATASLRLVQQLRFPKEGGGSLHGIFVRPDGKRLYASGAGSTVWEAAIAPDGTLAIVRGIPIDAPAAKGASYPCGLALSPDARSLYVCLSRANALAVVDLAGGAKTMEIPVGVAPFAVALSPDGSTAYVSNWGGRRAKPGERVADSSGTPTLIDPRGVASSGTVSVVDLVGRRERSQIAVGLHPCDLVLRKDGDSLYVANANDDTVSILSPRNASVRETVTVRPDRSLPFGSMPNALALSPNEKTLYVACGGNNAVAVVDLARPNREAPASARARLMGWIPAGWYPGAVTAGRDRLYVANIKGNGSRTPTDDPAKTGWSVYQYQGTIQSVGFPDAKTLAGFTAQVLTDSRISSAALRAVERTPAGIAPAAIPSHPGEPSPIEHVVYIIKENRGYDQVLGDLGQANGDPRLCLYGREITPNHHALAEQFVLLDNFYCDGVLSADGHSWATEGNCTDHLEKAFGGFTRSYTFGDDPLTYSSSGLIWDNALAHGRTFRNFGEMDVSDETPDVSYKEIWKDWQDKTGKITFKHRIGIERLARYSSPEAPGWNMDIPDQVRADIFLKELKGFEATGKLPNLITLYLPDDHTTGMTPGDPTPRSYLADNDLALGRVVEGISHSRFWPTTAVFVIEDDPQAGYDHVDGHRSFCLVASPYTRRTVVVHDFYNQTSVLHTMEQILGLPPMNQMDARAPLMTACFTNTPDLRPFTHLPNNIPLDEETPAKAALTPGMRRWAEASRKLNFRRPDAADESTLNQILWAAAGKTARPSSAANRASRADDDNLTGR